MASKDEREFDSGLTGGTDVPALEEDFSLEEIMALAELPPKETLQAQALGMMLAPITSLAIVLKAIAEKNGEPAAAEEAAPAEEAPAAE